MWGWSGIYWLASDERLNLEWRECDGPTVATPLRHGFGMLLLSRALDQFGGKAETIFKPTGLICKLSATLPENLSRHPQGIVPDVSIVPEAQREAAE
jgi:two-component sensor histidine kinase